jgi:hypothetical protein
MNGFDIAKGLLGFLASAGTGAIVENVIRHTMPIGKLTLMKKIFTVVGEVVVTGALSELTSTYAEKKVDQVENMVNGVKLAKCLLENKIAEVLEKEE